MSTTACPTFDEYLEALRALEAKGALKVLVWPKHQDDRGSFKLLTPPARGTE